MIPTYDRLPAHMQDGARRYIEQGIPPGSFLLAVLENNFTRAVSGADEINRQHLQDWAHWLIWDIPSAAWGSRSKVNAWMSHNGLEGHNE